MGRLESMNLPEPAASDKVVADATTARGRWWVWLLVLGAVAIGIWYYHGTHSAAQAQNPGAGPNAAPGGMPMDGSMPPVPVVVATAQHGDLPVYFTGLGTVTAFNTVTVHSRVDGQLISVAFKEGQYVNKGDVLAEIDPRPFQVVLEQAEGQLAKDQALRKDAQTNLERYNLLYGEGVIPKQQMDTQQSQVGQYDGAIKTDQATIDSAKLQLSFTHVTAPLSGRIGLRLVDAGNMVHANDPGGLLVITQLQPISVIFSLPQDQLPQVMAKLRAGGQLAVEAYDRDDTAKITAGTLSSIDNQIDTTTGTYKLKATFSNENNILFPNQFVNVHLLVDTKHNLTVVPISALQRGPQGAYVYAVDGNNTVKIRAVNVVQTTSESVGISSGLSAGDLVVTDGQDKLQDGSKVNPTVSNAPRRPSAVASSNSQQGAPATRGSTR